MAFVAWALGSLALFSALLLQSVRMCIRVARATLVKDEGVRAVLAQVNDAVGVRAAVRVRMTDSLKSPVVFGLFRPVLLLPDHALETLSPDELRAVLTHELCHMRRGDLWVNWLQALALTVYWFHPVVWVASNRLRALREEIVDDMVLTGTGVSAETYGASLLHVLRGDTGRRLIAPGYVGIAEDGSSAKKRVARIMDTKRSIAARIGIVSAIAVVALAAVMVPQARRRKDNTPDIRKERSMTPPPPEVTYGFRFDTDTWISEDASLEAALVRMRITKTPRAGDAEIIAKAVDKALAKQNDSGLFGGNAKVTGDVLLRLVDMGCGGDRPEVARAFDAMLSNLAGERNGDDYFGTPGFVPIAGVWAACKAGVTERPEVRKSLEQLTRDPNRWLLGGCPWTTTMVIRTLWEGRAVANTQPTVAEALRYINAHINDAGCIGYRDPWGFVGVAADVDLPEAKELCQRLIPLILRRQEPNGAWGRNPEELRTLTAVGALSRHGFYDSLVSLPGIPSDWKEVRSIALPAGKSGAITWDGNTFWLLNWTEASLLAISPEDGSIVKRVAYPEGAWTSLGMWDGEPALSQNEPRKRVVQLDPESGDITREVLLPKGLTNPIAVAQSDGRPWVADPFFFPGYAIDPDKPVPADQETYEALSPDRLETRAAGPGPTALAPTEDGMWHVDFWAGALIKSAPDGTLLEWGDNPVGWTSGIAWDGSNLWVKTPDNARLIMFEKSATAPTKISQPGGESAYQNDGSLAARVNTAANVKRDAGTVSLDGLTMHENQANQLGCLLSCARYLGYEESDAWLAGATAYAFALNIGDDLCPSGPSAWADHELLSLCPNVGLHVNTYFGGGKDRPDIAGRQKKALDMVRAAIDEGMPAIGSGMDSPELYVIVGYDDSGNYLYLQDHNNTSRTKHYADIGFTWFEFPRLGPAADDRHTLAQALMKVLALASGTGFDSDRCGTHAYDNWIKGIETNGGGSDGAGFGLAYNTAAWSDCRQLVPPFLKEAQSRINDPLLHGHFRDAIEQYGVVAMELQKLADIFPITMDDPEGMVQRLRDEGNKRRAVAALKRARSAEKKGLSALQHLLAELKLDKLDYTKLAFRGDIFWKDPFSMAVQAACGHFGRAVDYETIYALSGNSFAPDLREHEPCRHWWPIQGRGRNLDLVCARMGLSYEGFGPDIENPPPRPSDPAGVERWLSKHYRQPAVAPIREALDRGELILHMGGWKNMHGVAWTEWGFITGVTPGNADGSGCVIHGYASNGRGNAEAAHVREAWTLARADKRLSQRQAVLQILARAVARIKGEGMPHLEPGARDIVFGLRAMDAWVKSMGEVPGFCPECYERAPDRAWGCARSTALPTMVASRFSAEWLREQAKDHGDPAATSLTAAAKHYERIAELLEPAVADDGPEAYKSFIGDLEKQRQHAEEVLNPVKAELAAAGQQMSKALSVLEGDS